MQQIASQCPNCGLFARRSLHHEEEYHTSVLLERLRTSNFPATVEEITHIRHTILPTVSDDISSIDTRLASLHAVIKSMEEEKKRLKEVQDKYANLISLHRALPMEILSEIFFFTVSIASEANAFDASGPIWQLSHVCQRWRNAALSLRSFWSTMFLCFPKAAQCEGDVQRLQAVLQRTRQGLLDVSLLSDSRYGHDPNPSILKWSLNILYASLHQRLPRLESLTLHCDPPQFEENPAVFVFQDCPRLTKLVLSGNLPLGLEFFPWDQITQLNLSYMHFEDIEEARSVCIRLLGLCPSLEIFSTPYLDLENGEDEDELVLTPFICSTINKLYAASVHVVDFLTIPRLHEVSIHPKSPAAHFDILYPIKQLFTRSSCFTTLTSLQIDRMPLAASRSLLSIVSKTHNLTSLSLAISMQDFDEEMEESDGEQIALFVHYLTIIPTMTVTFLPLLSSLVIRIDDHHDAKSLLYFGPVGSFASTLKARWEGDNTIGLGRLKTCHFTVKAQHLEHSVYRDEDDDDPQSHAFSDAERHVFQVLIDDGMDLLIRVVTSKFRRTVRGDEVIFAIRG